MEPQEIIDLGRGALKACLMIGGPILLASLIVGLLVGVLQAMTQVPDQSVSFVPKMVCLVLAIGVALPWLTDRMLDYSREALATPMTLRHHVPTKHERTASRERPERLPRSEVMETEEPKSNDLQQPEKLPFQLPSYRFSRVPKPNRPS
jgi:flagellar biosynthetic protein FliQ